VLLNGTLETVALWIFDPILNSSQAVFRTFITRAPQIDEFIREIRERMSRAEQTSNRPNVSAAAPPPRAEAPG
jgi:hypothetical protein